MERKSSETLFLGGVGGTVSGSTTSDVLYSYFVAVIIFVTIGSIIDVYMMGEVFFTNHHRRLRNRHRHLQADRLSRHKAIPLPLPHPPLARRA